MSVVRISLIGCVFLCMGEMCCAKESVAEVVTPSYLMRSDTVLDDNKESFSGDNSNILHFLEQAFICWKMYTGDPSNTNVLLRSKECWQKAVELKKSDADWAGYGEVYFGLAQSEYYLGEVDQSIIHYQLSFQKTSRQKRKEDIATILQYIFIQKKDYREALHWFNEISLEHSDYFDSCLRAAVCYRELGQLNDANLLYQKVEALDPECDLESYYEKLGMAYADKKKYILSEKLFLKVKTHNPDRSQIDYKLALVYASSDRPQQALQFLSQEVASCQSVNDVFGMLHVNSFRELSKHDEYLRLFENQMVRFSDDLVALRHVDPFGDTPDSPKLLQFYASLTRVMYKWKNSDDPDDVKRRQKSLIEGYELVPDAKMALFIACTYAILEN